LILLGSQSENSKTFSAEIFSLVAVPVAQPHQLTKVLGTAESRKTPSGGLTGGMVRSLVGTAMVLVCFAVMLPAITGYWLWPNMDGDMVRLLGVHGLQDAVPFLDAEGVLGLEKLRMVEESDVDIMTQRHAIPMITAKLLKSKIRNKVLVAALEQIKVRREQENAPKVNMH